MGHKDVALEREKEIGDRDVPSADRLLKSAARASGPKSFRRAHRLGRRRVARHVAYGMPEIAGYLG
ncbi:MAG: hypothetical protein JNL38_07590 [Myxococcales bacterium]|nr:hypothetical protein [Myxococcales bacterium]